ncbi:MAG: nuclear transport factor 2 family protein [Pyrinomonadaceae bacterium]
MKLRKSISLAATVSAIVLTIIGLNFYERVSARQTGEEKAVTDVLRQNAAAFEKGDLATLDKIWANSEDVTVFENGYANYGWTDYRNNHLAPEMKEMKNIKYSYSDIKAKVSGNTAWATFKYTISADIGARHVDSAGLGTAVLEKNKGQWQIVHWHSSAPRRAASPSPQPSPKS